MSHITEYATLSLTQKRELVARMLREKAGRCRDGAGLVHRQFELQAQRSPEAIAVSCGAVSITYAELNARANRLARRLRAMGVGPEVLVGLFLGRTAEMVVGLLAIMKAGGTYVPLDPAYPEERLSFMLLDARASVVLTEEKLRENLPECAAHFLCVDADRAAIDACSSANLDVEPAATNLAYVIYTSGSTGRPKGVQITHGALSNLLGAMRALLPISERDALLAVTTLSFDIAAIEIFLPLIVGARVELVDRDVAADGARLAARLDDSRITFLQATPATWRLLLEAGWQGHPAITMLCGGEALPRVLANRLIDKGMKLSERLPAPPRRPSGRQPGGSKPVRRPFRSGFRLPTLASMFWTISSGPVPFGGIGGELYIGGAGLARGYRNRPGPDGRAVHPRPVQETPEGGRLYRTATSPRMARPRDSSVCLGRVDHQVKIRGFRVELEARSSKLRRSACTAVSRAVVTARPDPSGEMSLVAYIALRVGPDQTITSELRRWLLRTIPEYMVPSAFVFLDALPHLPNGKIDRQSLVEPRRSALTAAALFIPPRGPIEEAIADIWIELLGVGIWSELHGQFLRARGPLDPRGSASVANPPHV